MRMSDIVGHAGLAIYAEIGMILFMIAFVLVALRVFRKGSPEEFEEASRLPLEDDAPMGGVR